MARRRYQRGSVFLRGTRHKVWVGRWREDVIEAGQFRRPYRSEVLGSRRDLPTKKLAIRELEKRLARINSPNFRALRSATFSEFAALWSAEVLTKHKPSTQAAFRSQLKRWLEPYFGDYLLRDINGPLVQRFTTASHVAPKTCMNLIAALRMIWTTGKAWGYVDHDPFQGLVLPKPGLQDRPFFTLEEIQRIIASAKEPMRMFYWLAAETGMRAGELCGLGVEDINVGACIATVRRSVWRGQLQTPKSKNAVRGFAISPQLAQHLQMFLGSWRPNAERLLFSTQNGTPWDQNLIVKRKLHPLLDSLGIQRCGLHAFRHTNGSLMDQLHAPLKLRQERLGHAPGSDITLSVYTHTASHDDRELASKLGAILHPLAPKFGEVGFSSITEVLRIQ